MVRTAIVRQQLSTTVVDRKLQPRWDSTTFRGLRAQPTARHTVDRRHRPTASTATVERTGRRGTPRPADTMYHVPRLRVAPLETVPRRICRVLWDAPTAVARTR